MEVASGGAICFEESESDGSLGSFRDFELGSWATEIRLDPARVSRIHLEGSFLILFGPDRCEHVEGCLAGVVGWDGEFTQVLTSVDCDGAEDGAVVYDASCVALEEKREEGFGEFPDRKEIGFKGLAEGVSVDFLGVFEQDSCVVDQDVEAAKCGIKVAREVRNCLRIIDIEQNEMGVNLFTCQGFEGSLSSRLITRTDHNCDVVLAELASDFQPEPFVRSRDEGDLFLVNHRLGSTPKGLGVWRTSPRRCSPRCLGADRTSVWSGTSQAGNRSGLAVGPGSAGRMAYLPTDQIAKPERKVPSIFERTQEARGWSERRDSNARPLPPQRSALPS